MTKKLCGTQRPIRKTEGLRRVILALVVLLLASVLLVGAGASEAVGEVSNGAYFTESNRIQCAVTNANPAESVALELYSGTTKIATTTLIKKEYFENAKNELTVSFCIEGESSSWNTEWEPGHPISNAKPDTVILLIDGVNVANNKVTLHKNGFDQVGEEAVWANIPGVKAAPVVGNGFVTNKNGHVTVWGDAHADPEKSLHVDLYSGETKIATTKLNDIDGIYAADTYENGLTWHFDVLGECTDEYWTTTWEEGYPKNDAQPTKVVMYIDGIDAYTSEDKVHMNMPDDLNPVVWEKLFVAEVNDKVYGSIQAAINVAGSGDTITLLTDTAETGITVSADDNVIIDLGDYTVTGDFMVYGKATIQNGYIVNTAFVSGIEGCDPEADLTVKDLTVTSNRHALRIDGGKATIESGKYTTTVSGSSCYAINAGGERGPEDNKEYIATTVVINGGVFYGSAMGSTQGTAIMLKNDAVTTTITGGEFHTGKSQHSVENYGTMTITKDSTASFDGSIVTKGNSIYGGTFSQDPTANVAEGYAAFPNDDGTYIVKAGWIITWYNGEAKLAEKPVDAGDTPEYSGTEPTKEADEKYTYTFDGWSDTVDGEKLDPIPAATAKATYYAVFAKKGVPYTITYELNGGTTGENAPETHTYGTETLLVAPTKTGYTFGGWYTSENFADGTKVETLAADGYTAAINLYAKWTINQYTITFNTDGGSTVDPITQDYNSAITTVPTTPTRDGYEFNGWDTDLPQTMPAENMVITALWVKKVVVDQTTYSVSSIVDQIYTGVDITPAVTVMKNDEELTKGTGYTISYSNNKNVGTATATIAIKDVTDPVIINFKIVKDLNPSVSMPGVSVTFGTPYELVATANTSKPIPITNPTITITYHNAADCTDTAIEKPKAVGTYYAKAVLTETDNYAEASTIAKIEISNADFEVTATGYDGVYDGKPHAITVNADGATVTYSTDGGKTYSATNPTFTTAGTYTISFKAEKANYNPFVNSVEVKIAKAQPQIIITADKTSLTGSGTVTLTVSDVPAEGTVTVGCDDATIAITDNKDNTYTAELPDSTKTYKFTANYQTTANYTASEKFCTVEVTKAVVPPAPVLKGDDVPQNYDLTVGQVSTQDQNTLNSKIAESYANKFSGKRIIEISLFNDQGQRDTTTKITFIVTYSTLGISAADAEKYAFVVLHLINGVDTEIVPAVLTAEGLKVGPTTTSPFAIGYSIKQTGGSSTLQGSSVWLQEPLSPTQTPSEQPTTLPTDSVPTDIPTTQPTPTETETPGFGVLAVFAGLGAVVVLRRK